MRRTYFLSLIEELFEVEEGSLKEETVLEEIGAWDSLGVLNLISLADEKLGEVLLPKDLENCQMVADILNLLGHRLEN